jgi:hypothetical protein
LPLHGQGPRQRRISGFLCCYHKPSCVVTPQFRSVIIAHKGHVGGTFSFDTRDSTWDKTANDARLKDNWAVVKGAATSARTDFGIDTRALEVIDAVVTGASGIFVFSL